MYGINYIKPQVTLLQESGLGVSETAARTCYDSFANSENEVIKSLGFTMPDEQMRGQINAVEESSLLDDLAWTYFHHSILEHINLTYLIRKTSRGVLQEHARHRIQAISVRSTRYTMSSLINAFVASSGDKTFFIEKVEALDMFVTDDAAYNRIEISGMFEKLSYQQKMVENFNELAIAKSSLDLLEQFENDKEALYTALEAGKKKRNVGDAFKHIITDNIKVDMVVTFNLRSLKNYLTLRDSGAAYFQIRWLAQEMKKVTPKKYLDLIIKEGKKNA
jgi:thymidylate synthase (FAD)